MLKALPDRPALQLFWLFSGAVILSFLSSFYFREYLLMLIPPVLLLGWLAVMDFRLIYYLLFACLPLSFEYYFSYNLSTDLPTEPVIISLMGIFFFFLLSRPEKFNQSFMFHPVTFLILLQFAWMLFLLLYSE